MNTKQIILKKQYGDLSVVAQILTQKLGKYVSPDNASKMLDREKSKHHKDAVEVLRQVVEARERVLESA